MAEQRAPVSDPPEADDGHFLAALLSGVSTRAQALESELSSLAHLDTAEAAGRSAELEEERGKLGWGLVVAAGLLGADGAPARRESAGARWLAELVDLPPSCSPEGWPELRREVADWSLAHALVRWTWEAARHGGGAPRLERSSGGVATWIVSDVEVRPPKALSALLERQVAGLRCEADGRAWCLQLDDGLLAPGTGTP